MGAGRDPYAVGLLLMEGLFLPVIDALIFGEVADRLGSQGSHSHLGRNTDNSSSTNVASPCEQLPLSDV